MSKLVTFEQAKKLATIGYPQDKIHQYKCNDVGRVIELGSAERMYNIGEEWNAPTIHEALEWFREVKGIPCNVSLDVFEDEYRPLIYQYTGMYWEGYSVFDTDSFDTHSEAESALLDALIEYLS